MRKAAALKARKKRRTPAPLTYIMVQVRPRPSSRNTKFGGAFVSCWINYPHYEGALAVAKHHLRGYGWIFVRVAEHRYCRRSDYRAHASLRFVDEALADGASFVVHAFPKRKQRAVG